MCMRTLFVSVDYGGSKFWISPPLRLFLWMFLVWVRVFLLNFHCQACLTSTDWQHVHRSPIATQDPVSAVDAVSSSRPAKEAHRYARDQLLAATTAPVRLDPTLISRLKELSLGYNFPRRRPTRNGRRKSHRMTVVNRARPLD